MTSFATMTLPDAFDVIAPDGSEVRVLLPLGAGSMAHFRLPAGRTSLAVHHRTVEEIWYVVAGMGEMWRFDGAAEEITALSPGTCLTIPVGITFQFRSLGEDPLEVVGVTMPPWPGDGEAEVVDGKWQGSPTDHH
jgi:mannose-6-phosphate isomerase-like protein (cupin superfamily)